MKAPKRAGWAAVILVRDTNAKALGKTPSGPYDTRDVERSIAAG
jgi:hypothetical protein